MRIVSRSRVAGIGAAVVLALTIAPTAMAAKSGTVASRGGKVASTPVTTSGSAKFTGCVAGGSGTAKWSRHSGAQRRNPEPRPPGATVPAPASRLGRLGPLDEAWPDAAQAPRSDVRRGVDG
jgi:hypothetical protein